MDEILTFYKFIKGKRRIKLSYNNFSSVNYNNLLEYLKEEKSKDYYLVNYLYSYKYDNEMIKKERIYKYKDEKETKKERNFIIHKKYLVKKYNISFEEYSIEKANIKDENNFIMFTNSYIKVFYFLNLKIKFIKEINEKDNKIIEVYFNNLDKSNLDIIENIWRLLYNSNNIYTNEEIKFIKNVVEKYPLRTFEYVYSFDNYDDGNDNCIYLTNKNRYHLILSETGTYLVFRDEINKLNNNKNKLKIIDCEYDFDEKEINVIDILNENLDINRRRALNVYYSEEEDKKIVINNNVFYRRIFYIDLYLNENKRLFWWYNDKLEEMDPSFFKYPLKPLNEYLINFEKGVVEFKISYDKEKKEIILTPSQIRDKNIPNNKDFVLKIINSFIK